MQNRLSLPANFSTSASNRGWESVNYKIQENAKQLIHSKEGFRLTFWINNEEVKMWDLEKYNSNGWHLIHRFVHPGSTKFDWVLDIADQMMKFTSIK